MSEKDEAPTCSLTPPAPCLSPNSCTTSLSPNSISSLFNLPTAELLSVPQSLYIVNSSELQHLLSVLQLCTLPRYLLYLSLLSLPTLCLSLFYNVSLILLKHQHFLDVLQLFVFSRYLRCFSLLSLLYLRLNFLYLVLLNLVKNQHLSVP